MPRIRFKQNVGGFHAGDAMDLDDFAANALIRCGVAELEPDPDMIPAIPAAPTRPSRGGSPRGADKREREEA